MRLSGIDALNRTYSNLYVSPHMDDAVFSCGGKIAAQVENGEAVLVVTVFAGPGAPHSGRASDDLKPIFDTKKRMIEEERAMSSLGVDYLLLSYPDYIFRHSRPFWRYRPLFNPDSSERDIQRQVEADIEKVYFRTGNPLLHLPLGVGQHLDHQLLFGVGLDMLRREPCPDIRFYEEFPYAAVPGILAFRLRFALPRWLGVRATNHISLCHALKQAKAAYRLLTAAPTLGLGRPSLRIPTFTALVLASFLSWMWRKGDRNNTHSLLLDPEFQDFSAVAGTKIRAMGQYASQLVAGHDNPHRLRAFYRAYSRYIGAAEGSYVERYWRAIPKS